MFTNNSSSTKNKSPIQLLALKNFLNEKKFLEAMPAEAVIFLKLCQESNIQVEQNIELIELLLKNTALSYVKVDTTTDLSFNLPHLPCEIITDEGYKITIEKDELDTINDGYTFSVADINSKSRISLYANNKGQCHLIPNHEFIILPNSTKLSIYSSLGIILGGIKAFKAFFAPDFIKELPIESQTMLKAVEEYFLKNYSQIFNQHTNQETMENLQAQAIFNYYQATQHIADSQPYQHALHAIRGIQNIHSTKQYTPPQPMTNYYQAAKNIANSQPYQRASLTTAREIQAHNSRTQYASSNPITTNDYYQGVKFQALPTSYNSGSKPVTVKRYI